MDFRFAEEQPQDDYAAELAGYSCCQLQIWHPYILDNQIIFFIINLRILFYSHVT